VALRDTVHETGKMPDKEIIDTELDSVIELGREINEQIAILESDYWLEQAERYLLPTPKDEAYIHSKRYKRRSYFDEETLASLRSAVRKEQKERSENFRTWVTLLIGIIGALIGLVAVLKK
jgi:CRISPR/Cas system CSM-associated protein Csm4 (group 5 of RAMP superfamily)